MLSVTMIQQMFAYHYAYTRRLWQAIEQLSEADYQKKPAYGVGSLHDHMVHLAGVERSWIRALKGDLDVPRAFNPQHYRPRTKAHALWEEIAQEVEAYIATLDEETLAATKQGLPFPTWQVLLHVINHGTDHRAQMLRILGDVGGQTFAQDAAFYWLGR